MLTVQKTVIKIKQLVRMSTTIKTALFVAVSIFLLLFIVDISALNASTSDKHEIWVGHQVVFGETVIPVLGKRETRSDNFLLAKVIRKDNSIEILQTACKVEFKEIIGTKVAIPEDALLKLPWTKIVFNRGIEVIDALKADPWQVGWGKEDIDQDGNPGLTVHVDSSLCKGQLYVSSSTNTSAFGQLIEGGMMGKVHVRVKQKILGTNSACLKLFSSDSDETQTGAFVYQKARNNTTCKQLLSGAWPVTANIKR